MTTKRVWAPQRQRVGETTEQHVTQVALCMNNRGHVEILSLPVESAQGGKERSPGAKTVCEVMYQVNITRASIN